MERETVSTAFPLGSKLPRFDLPNVDGKQVTDEYLRAGKLGMVVFSCNHCPYVKGSEVQLTQIARTFQPQGLKVIAINSNDASQYPEDSFENMQIKADTLKLPYPYLYDESQAVAKAFDAACTPEVYLFDAAGTLVFHGTVNENPRDAGQAKKDFLTPAITQALSGTPVSPSFVHPLGCSIKWKR